MTDPETLKYQTIKSFLKATKFMLEQFPSMQSQGLVTRVQTLETQLETAYQTRNTRKLHHISQKADTLALDLLDYLDTLNIPPHTSQSLQA